MILKATAVTVGVALLFCVFSTASLAQSVLTVKHAFSILSETRPAPEHAVSSARPDEKGQGRGAKGRATEGGPSRDKGRTGLPEPR